MVICNGDESFTSGLRLLLPSVLMYYLFFGCLFHLVCSVSEVDLADGTVKKSLSLISPGDCLEIRL